MSLTFWKPSARVFNRLLMLHSPILRCKATSSYTSRLGVKHSSRKGGQGALCGARAPQFWGTSLRCWQYGSTRCGRRYSATSQLAAVQAAEPTDHQGVELLPGYPQVLASLLREGHLKSSIPESQVCCHNVISSIAKGNVLTCLQGRQRQCSWT